MLEDVQGEASAEGAFSGAYWRKTLQVPILRRHLQVPVPPDHPPTAAYRRRGVVVSGSRKGFASKQLLEAHKATHSEERRFACPNCEKRFKYQCDLYYHRRIHSGGVFQCTFKFCKYWTPQRNLLAAHLKTHTGERNHKCDLCDKAFIERTALLKHVRAIHEKLKPFKCEKCDYSASRNAHLTLHVKTVHDGAMPFECGKCDFEAKRADRLKEHVLKEHGNHVANNNKTKGTKETSLNCPSKAPEPDAPSTMPASKSGRATRNNKMSEAHVQVVEEGRNVSDTAGNDFESLGTLSVSAVNTPVPMHDGFRDRDSVPRKQFRRHWDHGIVFREIARNPGTESVKNFTAVMSHGFRHGTGITDSGEVVI